MTILSVDLAYRRYRDVGLALMGEGPSGIDCEFPLLLLRDPPEAAAVASALDSLARHHGARRLLIDGPQAWKQADNGYVHQRVCERALNTPAKTGLPAVVKPAAYTGFVTFSVQTFEALCALGWQRWGARPDQEESDRILFESFPLAAWRALGIPPLPAKAKTRRGDIEDRLVRLRQLVPLNVPRVPTHDELQAIVAGLAGIAMARGASQSFRVDGLVPALVDDVWREGLILNPSMPPESSAWGAV